MRGGATWYAGKHSREGANSDRDEILGFAFNVAFEQDQMEASVQVVAKAELQKVIKNVSTESL